MPKDMSFTYNIYEINKTRKYKIESSDNEIYVLIKSIYEDGYRFLLHWCGRSIVFRATQECEFDKVSRFLKVWWKIEDFPTYDSEISNYKFQSVEEAEGAAEIAKSALMKFASPGIKGNFEVVDVSLSASALYQIRYNNNEK